jgi:S-DNA-T family DNA segregation ATPase FtsK/SpoIIIE
LKVKIITLNEEAEDEELFKSAVKIVLEAGKASTSLLQRRLKIGYARAARLLDLMEEKGIVGPQEGSKPRKVLIAPEDLENLNF